MVAKATQTSSAHTKRPGIWPSMILVKTDGSAEAGSAGASPTGDGSAGVSVMVSA